MLMKIREYIYYSAQMNSFMVASLRLPRLIYRPYFKIIEIKYHYIGYV